MGTSFSLTGLLRRILSPGEGAARYLFLRADGLIIHDTSRSEDTLRGAHLPLHHALLGATPALNQQPVTGYDGTSDAHFAVVRLNRPDWLVAAALPGQRVRAEALENAQWALWTGLATLLPLLAVLAWVLRREVAGPLGSLTRAAERVAAGESGVRIPVERGDELGRLAHAFNDMAAKVAERDAALRRDKEEIEAALAAMRSTEERWRALTENASDLIVVVDGAGAIRYASPSVGRFLGLDAESLIGTPALDWVHPDDRARLAPFIAEPRGEPLRYRARNGVGEWRELESLASDLRSHPAVGGQVLNIRDVTEQVRAEAELARQREALHQGEKLAALGGLLAGVAHELNNPLAIVLGRAIQLEGSAATGAERETATKIRTAAERCSRIVKTFLAMARQHAPRREPTDVNAVIRSALDVLDYGLRSAGVRLELTLDPRLPPLRADSDQLGQVFLNLFTNALHALGRVEAPRRLAVSSQWDEPRHQAIIEVTDTGPGIPPEIQPRIFEPFFTTKAVGEGTGVGLSVSLGLVQAHGGKLELVDSEADGTRFRVTLPVAPATASAAGAPVQESPVGEGLLRVLIVDDEVELALVLRDILVPAGYAVTVAQSGREALTRLNQGHFDLVLTDLKMPDLDGPALYREIGAHHPHLAQRIIAITGDTLGGTARRFIEETGLPVVHKPFTPTDILRAVEPIAAVAKGVALG